MNLLDQLFGVMPEAERLRQLYADGKSLPRMPMPEWVHSQEPTELGMVRLPHVAMTGGGGSDWNSPIGMVIMALIGGGLIWLGYFIRDDFTSENSFAKLMVAGSALLIIALFSWFDYQARRSMPPEASTIEYSPGDTVLLMLPRRHSTTIFAYARLLCRERWYLEQGKSSHWKDRPLRSIPVSFSKSGANLLTASISLPIDAPMSYHTDHYRHEWVLAIAHVNWWGFTRTDHYLIWIGDGR